MSKIYLIYSGLIDKTEGNLSVVNGTGLFSSNQNIISFSSNMPNLTNGYEMFRSSNLTSFHSELPNLTNGSNMFYDTNLTSFSGDLPSLTNGSNMFQYCENLTTFSSDLSSLTNGYAMFGSGTYNCTKLDLASVQNIAETINDLASKGTTGTIGIGMQKALQSDDETAPINVALAAIRAKGWTVTEIYA